MRSGEKRWSDKDGGGECSRRGGSRGAQPGARVRPVRVLCLGVVLLIGLFCARHRSGHSGAVVAPVAAPTPFEASFAQARRDYFRAQVIVKRQLEALEEWDSDALRGSAPEIYRRSLLARTPEIGIAEAAAHEAVKRAATTSERYRAVRLLAHIECDRGHHRAELELTRRLVALWPHDLEALLMLQRAAEEDGQAPLARRAGAEASQRSGSPVISFTHRNVPRDRLSQPLPRP
jgi:hypothetical protein